MDFISRQRFKSLAQVNLLRNSNVVISQVEELRMYGMIEETSSSEEIVLIIYLEYRFAVLSRGMLHWLDKTPEKCSIVTYVRKP